MLKKQKHSLPMLEAVISFIDEGVLIANKLGQVVYQNPSSGKLLGLSGNEPLQQLNRIGPFNLQKELLRAAIDAGEVDAAGQPSGQFVIFEKKLEIDNQTRYLEFHSGLVECYDRKEKLRLVLIRDRTEQRRLQEVYHLRDAELHSNDPGMLEIFTRINQIAPSGAFVLLQGESGTGKTLLARRIHALSKRSQHPFVEVNCAAIPDSLIESELFGHVKGAFTGASKDRAGRFQTAHLGTLFLDEISEIPLHLQAKLLRAIQDQEFEMVGSDSPCKVNIRIIAASNKNLRELVDRGQFRADLFYRLSIIPLTIPPLRKRPGDIPLLMHYFIDRLTARGQYAGIECNHEALRALMNYRWPGNVRELENAIEHGIICATEGKITVDSLPQAITHLQPQHAPDAQLDPGQIELNAQMFTIKQALKRSNGSKADAAKLLGIDRTTLWRRMQRLGIDG